MDIKELRQCEVCGDDATIPCQDTTVEGVKTMHFYCDKHYPYGVAVTLTLPHPNYKCSDDTCWCHARPLGPFVSEEA